MKFSALLLILKKQFSQKWGRFLLSSGGIMIGIWAIALTTSLSLGLSDSVLTAINSQPFAREVNIAESTGGEENFFEFDGPPVFNIRSLQDVDDLVERDNRIADYEVDAFPGIFVQNPEFQGGLECVSTDTLIEETLQDFEDRPFDPETATEFAANPEALVELGVTPEELALVGAFAENCFNLQYPSSTYERFYQEYKSDWVGSKDKPENNQAVLCYDCNIDLGNSLGYENPEDMLGETLVIEVEDTFELFPDDYKFDVTQENDANNVLLESLEFELEIIAVVDDAEIEGGLFGSLPAVYLPQQIYLDAYKSLNPEFDRQSYGAQGYIFFTESFDETEAVVNDLRDQGWLVFALGLDLGNTLSQAFDVLTVVLSAFGFVALIASVFGIINVMTISVLERKKEIGILKSLGARDSDIFKIFWLESGFLGVLGWLLGMAIAMLSGFLISLAFQWALVEFGWEENLRDLNLDEFNPRFPWWLLLGTLAISVIFTSVSGLIPAFKASKQNPVEVLRGE